MIKCCVAICKRPNPETIENDVLIMFICGN